MNKLKETVDMLVTGRLVDMQREELMYSYYRTEAYRQMDI